MRLRELYETINLFEAYDTKVAKLHKEFAQMRAGFPEKPETQWGPAVPAIPGDPNVPDETQLAELVGFAEQAFKSGAKPSEQAMQWYLSLLETYYKQNDPKFAGKFAAMCGNYQFTDFTSLNNDLAHFFTSEYANSKYIKDLVKAIRPATTTVNALIANATAAEQKIIADNKKQQELDNRPDIELLEGDSIILPVGKYNWWVLPHSTHPPESKAMGHCGNASRSENYLLSLRSVKPAWPVLTFEWNRDDKLLYQSKGPFNAKPGNKFHPYILALILSDLISGISSRYSYQPANDFSVFDLSANDLRTVAEQKPVLIETQIEKYPIDILRAPGDIIKDYPNFRNLAIRKHPGLSAIIREDGTVDDSNETWEDAIQRSPDLLIYAPDTLNDWEARVALLLRQQPNLLGYCSAKIRGNYNIMKQVLEVKPEAIETVPLRAPSYNDLAIIAVSRRHRLLEAIPENLRTFELCKAAVKNFADTSHGYDAIPVDKLMQIMNLHTFTKEQQRELTEPLVRFDETGVLYNLLPDKDKSKDLADGILRNIRIHNSLSHAEKSERARNVFEHTPKSVMSEDDYKSFAVQVAIIDMSIVPKEIWTEDFMRAYVIWMPPTGEKLQEFLNTDMYKALNPQDMLSIDSTISYVISTGFDAVSDKYRDDILSYLRLAKDAVRRSNASLDKILKYINDHFTEIENDDVISRRCYFIYDTIIAKGYKTIDDLVMPKGTTNRDYKNLVDNSMKGECSNLIGLPDDLVAKNRKWYVDKVIEFLSAQEVDNADKLYNAIAQYSISDDIYADIFEHLADIDGDEVGYNIVNHISLSSFAKTDFLHDVYPVVMGSIVEHKILNKNPGLIKEASNIFAEVFSEDDVNWFQAVAREAFRSYFDRKSSNADCLEIFNGFNFNVLQPWILKYAVEKAPYPNRRGTTHINTKPMQQVYNWAMSKPAYQDIAYYVAQKFDLGPAEIVGDDNVEDVDDYNIYNDNF